MFNCHCNRPDRNCEKCQIGIVISPSAGTNVIGNPTGTVTMFVVPEEEIIKSRFQKMCDEYTAEASDLLAVDVNDDKSVTIRVPDNGVYDWLHIDKEDFIKLWPLLEKARVLVLMKEEAT